MAFTPLFDIKNRRDPGREFGRNLASIVKHYTFDIPQKVAKMVPDLWYDLWDDHCMPIMLAAFIGTYYLVGVVVRESAKSEADIVHKLHTYADKDRNRQLDQNEYEDLIQKMGYVSPAEYYARRGTGKSRFPGFPDANDEDDFQTALEAYKKENRNEPRD